MSRTKSATKSRRRPNLPQASFETLETRRMLTTMTVNGTAAADVIDMNVGGGLVSVIVNGGSPQVTLDSTTTDVVINGLAGADVININANGSNTVIVNGGTENDTVHIAASSQLLDNITDLITVNGDAGSDITSFHDESHTGTTSYAFTLGNNLARTGMSQVTFNTENVALATGANNDTVNVNGALSAGMNLDGNAGSDFLVLISTTNENATVSPSGTTSEAGSVTFGAQNISFTEMTRVLCSDLGAITIVTPNATDTLTLGELSGSSVISGFSGALVIPAVVFSDANSVTLDMSSNDAGAGNDSLNLTGSTQGTQLLRVINGTGNNTMTVGAGAYDLDVDLGATLGNTTAITIDGGAVTFHSQQNIDSLTVKNGAVVDFVGSGSVLSLQNLAVPTGNGTFNMGAGQSANVLDTCAIGASCTLFKTGAGGFAISATQTHGVGATFSVTAGTASLQSDAGSAASRTLNLIADGSTLSLFSTQHVNSVFAFDGGIIRLQSSGNRVLVTNDILQDFDSPPGKIDLTNNDLILDYTGASRRSFVQSLINGARNGGLWNGFGLTSSTALVAPKNTTLGVLEATEFKSLYGPSAQFDGQTIDNTAILVKYTYYGDTDFNGQVNFDDYSRLDNGFSTNKTGWLNGDFDGNGSVNFDDYSLIDQAFNTQGAPLRPFGGGSDANAPRKGASLGAIA